MNDLLLLHVSTDTPPSGAASQPSSVGCSVSGVVTTSGMKVNVWCFDVHTTVHLCSVL